MNSLNETLQLVQAWLIVQLILETLGCIALIVYAVKKGMFKYAFRKNQLWQLEETIEKQDYRIIQNECDLLEIKKKLKIKPKN